MGIINKLDQHTTNLIAAGEVIERVASVVKELVENSIDANATNIKIKLTNSGLSEIVVTDDGCGMDVIDAKLAIEPHATSKIKDGHDLFRIHTLGFRGEALPSIVAVSNFNLKTSADGVKGIMYSMKGGSFVSEAIISMPRGTEITVKNLFFNTPARLQNLSSESLELSYVTDYVTKTALANPHISFTLSNNNRDIIKTYGNNELLEVIMAVYGADVARSMSFLDNYNQYFSVKGYISKLGITRSTRSHITIIVNGRVIKNYKLIDAVVKGYEEMLVGGKYPIAVLNINVDPGLVDVNVHPAKLEIRFSSEDLLLNLITSSIKTLLHKSDLIVDLNNLTVKDDEVPPMELKEENPYNELKQDNPFDDFSFDDAFSTGKSEIVQVEKKDVEEKVVAENTPVKETFSQQNYTFIDNNIENVNNKTRLPKMSYIGQLHGTYLLAQAEDEFFIIDQHAAAERVNYERILEALKADDTITYELLVPFKLDFTSSEAVLIEEKMPEINHLGIQIEAFGGGTYMVRQVPVWFKKGYEKEYVEEIITQVINNKKKEKYEFLSDVAKGIACKKSIKGNEYHSTLEIEYLLEDLAKAKNPYTCPHGRPVIVKFSRYEIEKWFNRIV
jgi:DNA mismatch repair protein MutL